MYITCDEREREKSFFPLLHVNVRLDPRKKRKCVTRDRDFPFPFLGSNLFSISMGPKRPHARVNSPNKRPQLLLEMAIWFFLQIFLAQNG